MTLFINILFITFSFAAYNVGDYINDNHLNQEFDLCYPTSNSNNSSIKLGDYNGNTNGGDYHVLVIEPINAKNPIGMKFNNKTPKEKVNE